MAAPGMQNPMNRPATPNMGFLNRPVSHEQLINSGVPQTQTMKPKTKDGAGAGRSQGSTRARKPVPQGKSRKGAISASKFFC